MAKKPSKIIIDTNLWISFLIKSDFKQLDGLIKQGKIKILFSLESYEEFLSVVERPKFKKYFQREDVESLLELFESYGELVQTLNDVNICRDEKDNFLLALAKYSKADFLITGDNDLLDLKKFQGTEIITFTSFLKLKL